MLRLRIGALAAAACALLNYAHPAWAAAPRTNTLTATAGSVAVVQLTSFLTIEEGHSPIEILGASSGDVAGVALVGQTDWGMAVSSLNVGCRFAGPCIDDPGAFFWGTAVRDKVRGVTPGSYKMIILGRPGARVSVRLVGALAGMQLQLLPAPRVHAVELSELYPSQPNEMPEAYFDQQLSGPTGKNVTVLIAHFDASRPKELQFSSCVRTGAAPAVHVPRYGSACSGDDANQFGGQVGAAGVGGQDCTTLPGPACIPLTKDALHLSTAYGMVMTAPAHVSVTADFTALYSGARASVLTFAVP